MDNVTENIPQEPSKWKKILKFWLIVLWIMVLWILFISLGFILHKGWNNWINSIIYFIIWILETVLYVLLITNTFTLNKRFKWVGIFLLSIFSLILVHFMFSAINWVFVEGFITWFDAFYHLSLAILNCILILIRIKKKKDNKKKLKIALILYLGIFVVATWLQSTTLWFIPDWLWIKSVYNPAEVVCNNLYSFHYRCCNWYGICYEYLDYPDGVFKPIIYLYPTEETEVNVTLWTPENLSHTYPKYNPIKWWNVIAQPNGDLEDMDTWRKLYALYREWKTYNETKFDEWFVVAWKDTISFLEEKLAILWLNEREAEEFIVYWLPQMENNEYNLIRFETKEEQDENMLLNITPIPDTVIRVMMDWKAIEEPMDIPEQKLVTPERNWFTVVEWWWSPRN